MRKIKMEKGITLIALIITIVVLLILAVVAINSITNDGILSKATDAATKWNLAVNNEKERMNEYENFLNGLDSTGGGTSSGENTGNGGSGGSTGTEPTEEEIYNQHVLGTATNTENYGKKVNYTSKGDGLNTLVWRLFYQDDKNAYLISETAATGYPVTGLSFYTYSGDTYTKKDIVEKYNSGADVSVYGKALMPNADSSWFTESNTNENIIATVYLCDTEVWDAYTDAEGKASYAIGSPTIELFAASYNACGLGNTITLGTNSYGYTENASNYWFTTSQRSGIYNLTGAEYWWLASPCWRGRGIECGVSDGNGFFLSFADVSGSFGVRPVVSIPVSEFQTYTLTD